jgi:hypothetical protein
MTNVCRLLHLFYTFEQWVGRKDYGFEGNLEITAGVPQQAEAYTRNFFQISF